MKIGILTYHRSHNYGAMLQAVGLLKTLQLNGHEVFFIDYWPKHQSDIYRLWDNDSFKEQSFRGKISYFKHFLKTFFPKNLRRKRFNSFFRDQILPYCVPTHTPFDVIIYGSDQIWRKQYWGLGYNPVYFGNNDFKAKKHISYAASMGILPSNIEDEKAVLSYLEKLDAISVRESNLKKYLEDRGLKNIRQTIDPSILLDRKDWEKVAGKGQRPVNGSYLLLYDLQRCFDREKVQQFANERNLKILEIVGVAEEMPSRYRQTANGPYEFLKAIKGATFVLTSSFHGLAFSVIFNKLFYVMYRENGGRAESLLSKLSLTDRMLEYGHDLKELKGEINWSEVNYKLKAEVHDSLLFINEHLNS